MTSKYSINTGLPAAPLTDDPKLFNALVPVYNAIRNTLAATDAYTGTIGLEQDFWPQGGVSRCSDGLNSKIYLEAGENLAVGNLIGIFSNGKAYKSTSAGTPFCIGFCTTAVSTGQYAEIQLRGIYPTFSSPTLTPGNRYYQSATAGVLGASGTQVVGFAISDTVLYFNPQY